MSDIVVSRRHLLVIGGSALALLGVTGCNKEPASCTDVSGLSPEDIQARVTLEYVDKSPDRSKPCEKCQQWVEPTESGACGGCRVLKGPIHPKGYCKVYVERG